MEFAVLKVTRTKGFRKGQHISVGGMLLIIRSVRHKSGSITVFKR